MSEKRNDGIKGEGGGRWIIDSSAGVASDR